MKTLLVVLCSPRTDGASDQLARQFASGAAPNLQPEFFALRDHVLATCTGCGFCAAKPHHCIFDNDAVTDLFCLFQKASLVVFSSPIYFYALPANFKAFVDRGQKYWFQKQDSSLAPVLYKPVVVILTAGRSRGEKLFSGALLTLKYFLDNLDAEIAEDLTFPGMDGDCLTESLKNRLYRRGEYWGEYVFTKT